jgi:carbamoyl-phosphate synthase large subunit
MPKIKDVKKILVIGSGPITIGQGAEFDYSGTQAILALKEEGYEVILVNSNPATIMTDADLADKVYLEPLDLENVSRIIRVERPDAIIFTLGGQTGLNLGLQLYNKGILEECRVKILGTCPKAIEVAEDRKLFKEFCQSIDIPTIKSEIATTIEEAKKAAEIVGYPVVLRPAFTLGGTGGGFAYNEKELLDIAENALMLSPVSQVLVEKSIKGYKEVEFEVIRDKNDNTIIIAGMENFDPVGIHTGDSIVICPTQTLDKEKLTMLEEASKKIISTIKIEGGCNVQLALHPTTSEYYIIEINPRVSRSSALASKATAYPIAKVAAKIALGMTLDEIELNGVKAINPPKMDYVVAKFPRFPFDKFAASDRKLGTQMKATGEIMSVGDSISQIMLKGVSSLEIKLIHPHLKKLDTFDKAQLIEFIKGDTDERLYGVMQALRIGVSIDEIHDVTAITPSFLDVLQNIVDCEQELEKLEKLRGLKSLNSKALETIKKAKILGVSDEYIAQILGCNYFDVYKFRQAHNLSPAYKMINTSGNKNIYYPYFYSSYIGENQSESSKNKKIIVLGSGPIRIGQGLEFDYSTVHAVKALQQMGYEAIVINNNPSTISTDYTLSDKLYFEPLTFERVMDVVNLEKPAGVIVTLGGQTAINLAADLVKAGVKLIGTQLDAINKAEDREQFVTALNKLKIPMPSGNGVFSVEEAIKVAKNVGYPVLVRPSFVLGGRLMHVVNDDKSLKKCVKEAIDFNPNFPVLVDKYIVGKEVEVDAVCDGKDVFIPGILEHVERAGVHSGDSISVYPSYDLSKKTIDTIVKYTTQIGLKLGMIGAYNIQFIVDKESQVYVLEVNPRASRSLPFFAKATNVPVANIASKAMLGQSLEQQGYVGLLPSKNRFYVKTPTFSFSKIVGSDAILSPEMKSTGEAIGYYNTLPRAAYKSLKAANVKMKNYGTIFVSVEDEDKAEALGLVKKFYELGFGIVATPGTARFLKEHGLKTKVVTRISRGSTEILDLLKTGTISYVINTSSSDVSDRVVSDGANIRSTAILNKIPVFTCLDTVKLLLAVLEDSTLGVSTIDKD